MLSSEECLAAAGPRVINCNSWDRFKLAISPDLFGSGPFVRGLYYFRGHGSRAWPLISTFDRWYRGDRAAKAGVADQLIALFWKEIELSGIDVSGVPGEKINKIALAQHHGLPTRLLDWSDSPYVAAFFAFSGIGLSAAPAEEVAIWALDTRNSIWSGDLGVELVNLPTFGNERMRVQHGHFSLMRSPLDTLEDHVAHFPGQEHALRQYLIPSSEAMRALADLDAMGISHSRIFHGLDGCARAAKLRLAFANTAPS
jgi:hypothetical protein